MTLLISHIPKTAGTTLGNLVRKLNSDTVWVYGGELALGNPNLAFALNFRERSPPRVVMGHFSYGAHRLLGIKPAYVTVLRNPFDRLVSLYRHQKASADSAFAAHLRAGMSLKDFVSSELTEMTNNHACRVIAGIPPEAGPVINHRWLLELALHNIKQHYLIVGVMERMEGFITSVGKLLGWPAVELPMENVGSGPNIDMDAETERAIIEKNSLDIELYKTIHSLHS